MSITGKEMEHSNQCMRLSFHTKQNPIYYPFRYLLSPLVVAAAAGVGGGSGLLVGRRG